MIASPCVYHRDDASAPPLRVASDRTSDTASRRSSFQVRGACAEKERHSRSNLSRNVDPTQADHVDDDERGGTSSATSPYFRHRHQGSPSFEGGKHIGPSPTNRPYERAAFAASIFAFNAATSAEPSGFDARNRSADSTIAQYAAGYGGGGIGTPAITEGRSSPG